MHSPRSHHPLPSRIACLAVALALAAPGFGQEVRSGLLPGEEPGPFQVRDCTGPAAGKTLCYYCRYGRRPVVCVFTRELTDDVATLLERIEDQVDHHREQRMAAFAVYLGPDTPAADARLKEVARQHGLERTPLTIYADVARTPDFGYNLSESAAVTVIAWRDDRVTTNRAFATAEISESEIEGVMTGVAEIVKE